jgi:hypothetical protein
MLTVLAVLIMAAAGVLTVIAGGALMDVIYAWEDDEYPDRDRWQDDDNDAAG